MRGTCLTTTSSTSTWTTAHEEQRQVKQPSSQADRLETDANALCLAVTRVVENGETRPDLDLEIARVINRHGFDRLTDYLTGRVVLDLAIVARCRNSEATVVFADFFGQLHGQQSSELSGGFWRWVHDGRRPQIGDLEDQKLFVHYLLGLHLLNACELTSGQSLAGQSHRRRFRLSEQSRGVPRTRGYAAAQPLAEVEDPKIVSAAADPELHRRGGTAE